MDSLKHLGDILVSSFGLELVPRNSPSASADPLGSFMLHRACGSNEAIGVGERLRRPGRSLLRLIAGTWGVLGDEDDAE